ncbi:hypothetical protein EDB83DRAFT_2229491 [Lactarius deliciosus]|nr:hypothetical protein EDB83DRAFT_2229491 [Lactarius deliciosus]
MSHRLLLYTYAQIPMSLNEIEKKYAPPDNLVFKLVPPEFAVHANTIWTSLGCPQLQFNNV